MIRMHKFIKAKTHQLRVLFRKTNLYFDILFINDSENRILSCFSTRQFKKINQKTKYFNSKSNILKLIDDNKDKISLLLKGKQPILDVHGRRYNENLKLYFAAILKIK